MKKEKEGLAGQAHDGNVVRKKEVSRQVLQIRSSVRCLIDIGSTFLGTRPQKRVSSLSPRVGGASFNLQSSFINNWRRAY